VPYCEEGYIYLCSVQNIQQLFVDFKKVYDSILTEEVHNFLTKFSVYMKLITLIKMCLVHSIKVNICLMLLY